jgi:uncharacterized protein
MWESKNVLGASLEPCSHDPKTGFFRNGCCDTSSQDRGVHTVCVEITEEFLAFSRAQGNDLSTPRPEFEFEGLKAGDRWCLCASRWQDAKEAGKAPRVYLRSTHRATLHIVSLADLAEHSADE